jgi:hypothetical protein
MGGLSKRRGGWSGGAAKRYSLADKAGPKENAVVHLTVSARISLYIYESYLRTYNMAINLASHGTTLLL